MEVGGADYRKLKEEVDLMTQTVSDTERLLTRNKTTVSSSTGNLRRIDQEIGRCREDVEKLELQKKKLAEETSKNDIAGKKLLEDCETCQKVKMECTAKLDSKRNDFNTMKKEMSEIEKVEAELKDDVERLNREKNQCKDKCEAIKINIRSNRSKYAKSVEDFGPDSELEANPNDNVQESQENGEVKIEDGRRSRQSSVSQSQQEGSESRGSRASILSQQSLIRNSKSAAVAGYEHHLKHTEITYTFKDE